MGWRGVLQCTTAVLHYSSYPEPIQWIASIFFFLFYLQWLQAKVCWRVDDFHLWFLCPFLMFTGRTCTQLNWGIIKQTHQTSHLLQSQSSCRETLIKYVGSQTRWREATQACMCFYTWQEFRLGDERLGLAPTSFIFSKEAVIAQQL